MALGSEGAGTAAAATGNPYAILASTGSDLLSSGINSIGAYYAEKQRQKELKEAAERQAQQFNRQQGQKEYTDERTLGMAGLDYLNSNTAAAQHESAPNGVGSMSSMSTWQLACARSRYLAQ